MRPAVPLRPRLLALVLASALSLGPALVAGCGVDAPEPSAAPTTTTHVVPTLTDPSTTLGPDAEDEATLRQLAEDWYETRNAIYSGEADASDAERFLTGAYLRGFLEDVEEYEASGNTSERRAGSRLVIEGIEIASPGETATVFTCVVDADLLRGPDETPLNDEILTMRYLTTAQRTGDQWRFDDHRRTSEEEGDTCAG